MREYRRSFQRGLPACALLAAGLLLSVPGDARLKPIRFRETSPLSAENHGYELGSLPVADGEQSRVTIEPRAAPSRPKSDLRADADLVLVPVSVTDSSNRVVTGLNAAKFRVFDDGKEQKLSQFAIEDAPVSVGIVFDTSASMAAKLSQAKQALTAFLATSNPEDEFFLVQFSNSARLAVPLTSNADEIQNHLLFTESSGRTALWDAIYLALQLSRKSRNPRRALLVISDGGDNESRFTQSDICRVVRESDTWIYVVLIGGNLNQMLPEEELSAPSLLSRVADDSGGRLIGIRDARELREVASKISLELHNRYLLAFSPGDGAHDGRYHRLQVKLVTQRHLSVSSRRGYYAPEQ